MWAVVPSEVQFEFQFLTLSLLVAYIYSLLRSQNQSNLVHTRADEVPVIGNEKCLLYDKLWLM